MATASHALLSFKKSLKDPSSRLSSWDVEADCCKWAGVVCNNLTGHVRELHLQNPNDADDATQAEYEAYVKQKLGGEVNPSLLNLKHLSYLDLSQNDFGGIPIPSFLGSLTSLRYLNLSEAGFAGTVPHQLGNLSSLRSLGLKGPYPDPDFRSDVENLDWLSGLSTLEHLDLSHVKLNKMPNWLQVINKLPSLVELHLSECALDHMPPLEKVNFTSLAVLDLSRNEFDDSMPRWIFSLSRPIPSGLRNMTSLRELDLSMNDFNSSIPNWLYSFRYLELLDLYGTRLHGTLSSSIENLTSLVTLDLSSTELRGRVPREMGNLCNLRALLMSSNRIEGNMSELFESLSGCISYSLVSLQCDVCGLSGHLTDQLEQFKSLKTLELSGNSLSGPIPVSFGRCSSLEAVNLWGNKLTGSLPENFGYLSNLEQISLGHNLLEGVVSEVHFVNLTSLKGLYASGNQLVLKVSPNWIPPFQLETLRLGSWHLGPQFPRNDEPNQLEILHLGENQLFGEIPNCWENWPNLKVIQLGNNHLSGNIPSSLGFLSTLESLHLRNNSLSGEVPSTLENCTQLVTVDLGLNLIVGSFPTWLGRSLSNLKFLSLRSNYLHGQIPSELCHLSSLQILDLANNGFSGPIPHCLKNLTAMVVKQDSSDRISYSSYLLGEFLENAFVVTKGREDQYDAILSLATSMDLSDNNISGEIPEEVTSLLGLRSLNLPGNHLTGAIPKEIGNMGLLESLDLSRNQLSGKIPQSMSTLRTSTHTELQHRWSPPEGHDEEGTKSEVEWFYVTAALGFVVGFWVVFGPLLYKRSWRDTYFEFLDEMWKRICNCLGRFWI
ncbi:hypothetical protein Vadar_012106 [Vaccinium darrowii]|uniref:Uncharacterized protein n=1 Tax=Vaccinium darrowii TaxID=229202 RepID=A0ACB7YKW2_9ERIC|nr:hypothetical protein Vadar_012106 [Vaccinium darrowii]